MMLTPLNRSELNCLFDSTALNVLNFCMLKTLLAQPERLPGQAPLPIQTPKEHLEQWVVQAIGAVPVGAGSYPIDVMKPNEFGADIKMLSCKINAYGELSASESGETSLAQNFTDGGVILDLHFANKEYELITNKWTSILKVKLGRVKTEQGLDTIYYIFILRASTKFYLCATKVNLDAIDSITPNITRSSNSSVYLDNVIDDSFGSAKIYKAKKRLELRLRPKTWVDNGYVIPFDFNYITPMVNLRQIVDSNHTTTYLNQLVQSIMSNEIR